VKLVEGRNAEAIRTGHEHERLAEQRRWLVVQGVPRLLEHDVLRPGEGELAVRLHVVQQRLGFGGVDGRVADERPVDEVDAHRTGQRLVHAAEELDVAGIDRAVDVAVAAGGVPDLLQRIVARAVGRGDRDEGGDGGQAGRETEPHPGTAPGEPPPPRPSTPGAHDVGPV
jgi:hypothetical protein